MKKIAMLMLFFIPYINGCAYSMHELHVSDYKYPVDAGNKKVEANSEQFVILGFVFDTNYVDAAYEKLRDQCQRGTLDGINTKYYTALGFFSWHNHINLSARCVDKKA